MEQKITILLVDDHPLARQGVRTVLEQADDLEIVAEAGNGQEAIQLVASLQPNILLLDLKCLVCAPPRSRPGCVNIIRRRLPWC
jgi:DNA-binding NarL/FixJ family response regulator